MLPRKENNLKTYVLFVAITTIAYFNIYYSVINFNLEILIPWLGSWVFFMLWLGAKNTSKAQSKKYKVKRYW